MVRNRNPFVVNKYIENRLFCRRDEEKSQLIKQIDNGRNVVLISPRRIGKTSLIYHIFNDETFNAVYHPVYVDIYSTTSVTEFVFQFGKEVFSSLKGSVGLKKKFAHLLKSLSLGIEYNPISGEPSLDLQLNQIVNPLQTLDEIFEYLEECDKPCVVCIDEFQQIGEYKDKTLEATLRGYIQRCRKTGFIFAGSHRHMMLNMFNSSARPFYNSAVTMEIRPFAKKVYVDFAESQFKAQGKGIEREVIEAVYDMFEAKTWHMQLAMNELYSITEDGEKCDMSFLEVAIENILMIQYPVYAEIMANLSQIQKAVLASIARETASVDGAKAMSSEFVNKYRLQSASSVQGAMKSLITSDLVSVRTEGGWRIADPLFAMWLRKNY